MFLNKHLKAAVSTAIVLTLLGVVVAPLAYGRISLNTIDPVATVSDNGRRIVLTGPLQTDVVERIFLRVTVTQRTTGAVAEGIAILRGTGELQHWEVQAKTRGKASFDAGPATAVAIGVTSDRGQTTDAHQWLVNITLEKK
jgi:hypothetical protein